MFYNKRVENINKSDNLVDSFDKLLKEKTSVLDAYNCLIEEFGEKRVLEYFIEEEDNDKQF